MKSASLINLCLFLIFLACSDEDPTTSVVADFDVVISGEAPDATIAILNKSKGATEYTWVFSENTGVPGSSQPTPPFLQINKAGEVTIELTVNNGTEEDILFKTFRIHGK